MTPIVLPYPYLPETPEEKKAGSFALRVQADIDKLALSVGGGTGAFILIPTDRVYGPTSQQPTVDDSYSLGFDSQATAQYAVSLGTSTMASGVSSFAEGETTIASGEAAHAEGLECVASGAYSHAEGWGCTADGTAAHAEGSASIASGIASHAEGFATALYYAEHAESSVNGSMVYSSLTLTLDTTDATPTTLLIGAAGGDEITIPAGEIWKIEADVAALIPVISGATTAAGFHIAGLMINESTGLRIVGTTTIDRWNDAGAAGWTADLAVGSGNLRIVVTGQAATHVRWAASLRAIRTL